MENAATNGGVLVENVDTGLARNSEGATQKPQTEIVKLNIGGVRHWTTRGTLEVRGPNFFTALLALDGWGTRDEDGFLFVDRCGVNFGLLLDHLRGQPVDELTAEQVLLLEREARFYSVDFSPPTPPPEPEPEPQPQPEPEPASESQMLRELCASARGKMFRKFVCKNAALLDELHTMTLRALKSMASYGYKPEELTFILADSLDTKNFIDRDASVGTVVTVSKKLVEVFGRKASICAREHCQKFMRQTHGLDVGLSVTTHDPRGYKVHYVKIYFLNLKSY